MMTYPCTILFISQPSQVTGVLFITFRMMEDNEDNKYVGE